MRVGDDVLEFLACLVVVEATAVLGHGGELVGDEDAGED